jgi:hypothetical protein
MGNIDPVFPALLVHNDGSISGFFNLTCWTKDVDQWFWSVGGEYLVDSRGWRFDQVAERSVDLCPAAPPLWRFTQRLEEDYIQKIVAEDARSLGKPEIDGAAIALLVTSDERIALLVQFAYENSLD